jgi:hypothetical protein
MNPRNCLEVPSPEQRGATRQDIQAKGGTDLRKMLVLGSVTVSIVAASAFQAGRRSSVEANLVESPRSRSSAGSDPPATDRIG